MQQDTHTQNILKKFVLNKCSKEEAKEAIAYFQNIKKSNQLPSVEDVLELLDEKPVMISDDANQIFVNIKEGIESRDKKTKKIYSFFWKYAAAVLVGVLATAYFFKKDMLDSPIENTPILVNTNPILTGTDKATLTLEDGSVVELDKDNEYQTKVVKSNGEQIEYKALDPNTNKIVYNYLTIPRGGQFFIKLSDGTQVWLNSESQLKYPVQFKQGVTRQVELVYGEAYFDVSPSTEHNGSKFKVLNRFQEVEVIGTEFNIKAYKDEKNIYTTLIEGKVAVDNGVSMQDLTPNQQSNLDTDNLNFTVAKVDVKEEISWKEGVFSFKGKPLKDIMKVISRWYDVDIVFENKSLEKIKFKGTLDKLQSIEEILSIMKSSSINNYEINNKTIILK